MRTDVRILVRDDPINDDADVAIFVGDDVALPLVFKARESHVKTIPTIGADGIVSGRAFLRAALNAAWAAGMRPDGFEDTRESMKATNRHLEDMRAITFGKLGIERP